MATIWKLADMTWEEADVALKSRPVGLLPVGAIEAHGPHLPLDTDVIIAEATAARALIILDELGVPAIVLPSVTYSVSFAGTSFRGTSPVAQNAFQSYVRSILENAATQGYRMLVCCNAHLEPAHVDALLAACRDAEDRTGIPVRCPDQRHPQAASRLGREFAAGSRHAGAYETSIVLHARPGAVRTELMSGLKPIWIDLPAQLKAGAKTFSEAGSTLGYFGDPRSATAATGAGLLDTLGAMIVEAVEAAGVTRDCL